MCILLARLAGAKARVRVGNKKGLAPFAEQPRGRAVRKGESGEEQERTFTGTGSVFADIWVGL